MQINIKHLCAINKCAASKEHARYYLRGVHVKTQKGWVVFAATDGHKLIVHRVPNTMGVEWDFIIPREKLDNFKLGARSPDEANLTFDGTEISLRYEGSVSTFRPVDGSFPDYQRVIGPGPHTPAASRFNPKYLVDLDVLAAAFGASEAYVTPRAKDPALVTIPGREDIWGAITPKMGGKFEWPTGRPF